MRLAPKGAGGVRPVTTSALSERQQRAVVRSSDHHLSETRHRLADHGLRPDTPSDMKCSGKWEGGDRCEKCGGRACPDCLAGARKNIEMKGSSA
jgi:hypothetical protein